MTSTDEGGRVKKYHKFADKQHVCGQRGGRGQQIESFALHIGRPLRRGINKYSKFVDKQYINFVGSGERGSKMSKLCGRPKGWSQI